MEADPAIRVARDDVHGGREGEGATGEAGLLPQLPPRGVLGRLAELLGASGDGPDPGIGRVAPANQEDVIAAEQDDADADPGPVRVFAKAQLGRAFRSSSDGAKAFAFQGPT